MWLFASSLLLKGEISKLLGQERADKFKTLFREVSVFDRPVEFWNDSVNSTFYKNCKYYLNLNTSKVIAGITPSRAFSFVSH